MKHEKIDTIFNPQIATYDPLVNRKQRRSAKHANKYVDSRNPLLSLMLLPNEQIQAMILAGSSSSYVPTVQRTDNRPFAELERIRKGQNRRKQANV